MQPLLDPGVLSLLPPLLIIVLALATRQVFVALLAGLWSGFVIYIGSQPPLFSDPFLASLLEPLAPLLDLRQLAPLSDLGPLGTFSKSVELSVESLINVFQSPYQTRVILFSALVGSLILLTQRSGGVSGFINRLGKSGIGSTRRGAQMFSFSIGFVIFIESSITSLVAGSVSRPLFDRLRISREKLAYILDSTAAPICILIPINAWGGTVTGILSRQGLENGFGHFLNTIPLNFYPILTILFCVGLILVQKDFGPMAKAQKRVADDGALLAEKAVPLVSEEITKTPPKPGVPQRAINLVLPIAVMTITMPLFLVITGGGNFFAGSGSQSVLFAVLAGLGSAFVLYRVQGVFSFHEFFQLVIKGAGGLISLSLILMLAFAVGHICELIGTGRYLAGAAGLGFGKPLIPAVLFLLASAMGFATGTSWGTWAIMIPISLPIVLQMGAPLHLCLGAVLGGGVFGDHCSPISDTTVVASLAAATDHIDHVRTQLPYALTVGVVTTLLYVLAGFQM